MAFIYNASLDSAVRNVILRVMWCQLVINGSHCCFRRKQWQPRGTICRRNAKITCHCSLQLMKTNPRSKPLGGRRECFCLTFNSVFFFILEHIKAENSWFTHGFPSILKENRCSRGWRTSLIKNISPLFFPVLFTGIPNRCTYSCGRKSQHFNSRM